MRMYCFFLGRSWVRIKIKDERIISVLGVLFGGGYFIVYLGGGSFWVDVRNGLGGGLVRRDRMGLGWRSYLEKVGRVGRLFG